jgi:4-diphosphocytidyl-2C-methyl-D-erythritol kinase
MAEPVELHENADKGHHDPDLAPVSVTMAIIAVCIAAASLLGQGAHTEEIVAMTKATDQWAYYQAKDTRLHNLQLFQDMLDRTDDKNSAHPATELRAKYQKDIDKYTKQMQDIQKEARDLEQESQLNLHRANRYDLGEGFLEAALVIASLTILTRRRLFWFAGIVVGLLGVGTALSGFLVH